MNESEPLHQVRQAPERFSGRMVTWIIVWSILGTIVGVEIARLLWHDDLRSLGNVARTPSYPVSETVGEIEQKPIIGPARGGARTDESLKALERYGWVDRQRGVAQIPIERAMQWLADDAKRGALQNPDPATTPDAGATARAR
jgi:hypothetical protein